MQVELNNMMERLVLQRLDETIDKLGCCACEKCRMDIASYVLNRLPPKYVATYTGELYSKLGILSFQYEADMLKLLLQGAELVKANPHHTVAAGETGKIG